LPGGAHTERAGQRGREGPGYRCEAVTSSRPRVGHPQGCAWRICARARRLGRSGPRGRAGCRGTARTLGRPPGGRENREWVASSFACDAAGRAS
jgi:hypothetical protein